MTDHASHDTHTLPPRGHRPVGPRRATRPRARLRVARSALVLGVAVLPVGWTVPPGAAAEQYECYGLRATIVGTAAADTLTGTPGVDVIVGLGGNDAIDGGGGDDTICGGDGNDELLGGDGGDDLVGDAGDDDLLSGPGATGYLEGGPGEDLLVAQGPRLALLGEAGDDVLQADADLTGIVFDGGRGDDDLVGTDGIDEMSGGLGDDTLQAGGEDDESVDGGPGDDTIEGGDGLDVLRGGPGNDILRSGPGVGGSLHGGPGKDQLEAEDVGIALHGDQGSDTLTTRHDGSLLDGGTGGDVLVGGDFADSLDGGTGDDRITAGGGDDVEVHGGAGKDRIDGGEGDDRLHGDDGDDTCTGGPGSDLCDGGAPGGPQNSPEDNDVCTAETLVSCRGGTYPDAFLLHVEGTYRHADATSREDGEWTLDIVLRRGGKPDETWYVHESIQASWSGQGASRGEGSACDWAGSGGFKDDPWSADLQLFPDTAEYFLDFGVAVEGTMHGTCTSEFGTDEIDPPALWGTWEDSGDADLLPWDPDDLRIVGSETKDHHDGVTTHEWTITPLE